MYIATVPGRDLFIIRGSENLFGFNHVNKKMKNVNRCHSFQDTFYTRNDITVNTVSKYSTLRLFDLIGNSFAFVF